KRVTSAASYGRLLTQINLELDPVSHDVIGTDAHNLIVTRDNANTPVDAYVKTLVKDRVAVVANRVIGHTPVLLQAPVRPLPAGASGEYSLGSVIADAMLWA